MMGAQRPRPVLRLEHVSKIYPTGEVLRVALARKRSM